MVETGYGDGALTTWQKERQNLSRCLEQIWRRYFPEMPRANKVVIRYCYPWKNRLGLITLSLDRCVSFIGINALLQNPGIPDDVLLITIAHELTYYGYGVGSPLPFLCMPPHEDRMVDRELERRNMGEALHRCNEWIDKYWHSFYDRQREVGWAGLYGVSYISTCP